MAYSTASSKAPIHQRISHLAGGLFCSFRWRRAPRPTNQDTAAQPSTVINKAVGQPKDTVRSIAGRPPRAIQPGWCDAPRKLPMAKVGRTAKEIGAPAPAL